MKKPCQYRYYKKVLLTRMNYLYFSHAEKNVYSGNIHSNNRIAKLSIIPEATHRKTSLLSIGDANVHETTGTIQIFEPGHV